MTILTVPEAAAMLRVSQDTVRALVRGGAVPHFRVGRQIRFTDDQLAAWIAAAHNASHGEEATGARERGRDRLQDARRPAAPVGGGARRRLDTRRKADPAQPLRVVGAGGEGDAG